MQRIQDVDAVASRPTIPTLAGVVGYFTNGNPTLGVPATPVPDWWLNMQQEELCGLLVAAGLPLDGSKGVLDALAILMQVQPATYVASATLTVPAWANAVDFEMVGPGGSSGGASGTGSAGGGGGGGAYVRGTLIGLTPLSSIVYTHGVPGSAGAVGGNGVAGTDSTFGGIATAGAGHPGGGATGALATSAGLGGTASIGTAPSGAALVDYRLRNGDPGGTPYVAGSSYVAGNGGGTEGGAGTAPVVSSSTTSINGFCNSGAGVGACGGVAGGGGGGGSPGYLRVRWRRN